MLTVLGAWLGTAFAGYWLLMWPLVRGGIGTAFTAAGSSLFTAAHLLRHHPGAGHRGPVPPDPGAVAYAGLLVDRHAKRRVLLGTQIGLGLVSAVLGQAVLTGDIRL
jgi:hypothetical protein